MKPSGTIPDGFICNCGKEHKFTPAVYSQWNIMLIATCDCKREYELFQGVAHQVIQADGLVKK